MPDTELTWRPLTIEDMAALADLMAAGEKVEPTGEHHSVEDITEICTTPSVDFATGSVAAWDGGLMVAYALVRVRDAAVSAHQMRVEAAVHPEYRSEKIARHLIDWLAQAAIGRHRATYPGVPLELHGHAHEGQRWYRDVLEAAGYQLKRTFVEMKADLATRPASRELPADLRLVPYDKAYDEETRVACNAMFADHWGSTPASPETWQHRVVGSASFRPQESFLLMAPDREEVLALVLSSCYESDATATGIRELFVGWVGTAAELRGRGVATALLGHTLDVAAANGFQRAALSVDAENVHSAIGIYRRCGFEISQTWYGYVLSGVETG